MTDTADTADTADLARKTWRTLEPLHGMIYFVPEAVAAYAACGLTGRSGYFASRSAPMGAVTAAVVRATFFNFNPVLVDEAMDGVWEAAAPSEVTGARLEAADAALRRLLGDTVAGAALAEAAGLARQAAAACRPEGRPLYAGHASLPWPEAPHLVLWHAQSLLREFRGDGHVAALLMEGLSGVEALITHAASGEVPAEALRLSRAWTVDAWSEGIERLRQRGWVTAEGNFTEAGAQARRRIEQRTDELAAEPYAALGAEGCARLRQLARPLSQAVVEAGTFAGGLPGVAEGPVR